MTNEELKEKMVEHVVALRELESKYGNDSTGIFFAYKDEEGIQLESNVSADDFINIMARTAIKLSQSNDNPAVGYLMMAISRLGLVFHNDPKLLCDLLHDFINNEYKEGNAKDYASLYICGSYKPNTKLNKVLLNMFGDYEEEDEAEVDDIPDCGDCAYLASQSDADPCDRCTALGHSKKSMFKPKGDANED